MNVLNEEVRAIRTNLAVLRKMLQQDPTNESLKIQIKQLEIELDERLEKIL